jgi:hypothetical protein
MHRASSRRREKCHSGEIDDAADGPDVRPLVIDAPLGIVTQMLLAT